MPCTCLLLSSTRPGKQIRKVQIISCTDLYAYVVERVIASCRQESELLGHETVTIEELASMKQWHKKMYTMAGSLTEAEARSPPPRILATPMLYLQLVYRLRANSRKEVTI